MSIHLHLSSHRSIALFLGLTLGLVACGSDDSAGSDQDEESIAVVETTTTAAVATTTAAPPESPDTTATLAAPTESSEPEEPAPSDIEAGPAVFDAAAPEIIQSFSPIEVGTHRVNNLGTPFSFTLDEPWFVYPIDPGFFPLGTPNNAGPGDRDIIFVRATGLADPDAPNANREDQTGWPLDDIDGWLDNLTDGITITNRQTVDLGGRTAVRFDLRVEETFECGTTFCMGFVANRTLDGITGGVIFDPGVDYRIHWIDEGESPIVVVLGAGSVGPPFFEQAESVLATLAFGDPEPHPIDPDLPLWEQGLSTDVPAGRANFPVAGLSFELADERFVRQSDGLVGVLQRTNSGIYMFKATGDLDGNPLATSDAVVEALLADTAAEATEVEVSAESAYPIREFDTAPDSPNTLGFKWSEKPGRNNEYHKGPFTRFWVIDTPDGVVVVAAESSDESAFEGAVTEALGLIATLQTLPAA